VQGSHKFNEISMKKYVASVCKTTSFPEVECRGCYLVLAACL